MILFSSDINASVSMKHIEEDFLSGHYKRISKFLIDDQEQSNEALKNQERAQILLLAMGDFRKYFRGTVEEENLFVQKTSATIISMFDRQDPLAVIIKALWHVNDVIFDDRESFPSTYQTLFSETEESKNPKVAKKLLSTLAKTNPHAAYMLAKIYLRPSAEPGSHSTGNDYLIIAARLNHFDAQALFRRTGTNWNDEDQFGDHCEGWCLIPNCRGTAGHTRCETFSRTIHSCVGCGPSSTNEGWADCNCCLWGYSTELNSAQCAKYATRGFLNILKTMEHPIKLCTALSSIVGTILQAGNYPGALVIQGVAAGCATLSAFVKQETSLPPKNSEPPPVIDQQPSATTSIGHLSTIV